MELPGPDYPAPAKLNLFLHVTGRRADGYHELESLFVALDFGDSLTLTRRDDETILRTAAVAGIAPDDDLAVRAARALQRATASRHAAYTCCRQLTSYVPLPVSTATFPE